MTVVVDSEAPADDSSCTTPGVAVASATGQTVVYRLMISVVTEPILAGQLVTVGAQDVIV